MALSLIVTTLLSVILFVPLAYYLFTTRKTNSLSLIIFGGASWSIVAVVQYIIIFLFNLVTDFNIISDYSVNSISSVMSGNRALTFWYILLIPIVNQIILYQGTVRLFPEQNDKIVSYLFFGAGCGVSEFIHRFAFLEMDVTEWIFLFIYTLLLSVGLASTIIRVSENTKFIVFATFLKSFSELGIFGTYAFQPDQLIPNLTFVIILTSILLSLSYLTKKYPLKED